MLFDRYSKLKKTVSKGTVYSGQKQLMPLLRGRLEKTDLPAVIVEPDNAEELRGVISHAGEKGMKIAVANGVGPSLVDNLDGQMLVLTSRLRGPIETLGSSSVVRVDAGVSVETIAVELAGMGRRWMPLHPVPAGESLGSLIASGWEGFRNWDGGGTLAGVRAIEWIGFDGNLYVTGAGAADEDAPDVSGLLFGSKGAYGVITSVELLTRPLPPARTLILFELPSAERSVEALTTLRGLSPLPETIVYFGEMATEILRSATDGTVTSTARVLLVADWPQEIEPDSEMTRYVRVEHDVKRVNGLWQDLFRLPRTAARLSPERTTARLKLPDHAIINIEERARDLSRDYNLGVVLWGTLRRGYVHVWILQPDGEPRTCRQARDLLKRLIEDAVRLGGCSADAADSDSDPVATALRRELLERCDPLALHLPLRPE